MVNWKALGMWQQGSDRSTVLSSALRNSAERLATQTVCVQLNTEARSCNSCCSGKALSIINSECAFVALGIHMQCACATLSSVACLALQYFSTLFQKRHDFRKKVVKREICVLTSSITFVKNYFSF
jgi:hypothetical protein